MNQAEVAMFQEACGQVVNRTLTLENHEQAFLYAELVREETQELLDAFKEKDIVGVADGAADLIWVVLGLCNTMGIQINPVWREVMLSNMSKIPDDGKVIRREDGKILKPDSYFPPNIKKVLGL
jgi:predicted HAD superfamily Cof-like phosphohydrolase